MKKILVFGSAGMLGRYVKKYFENYSNYQVISIDRTIIDVESITHETLTNYLLLYSGAIVINCIGKIPQRGDNNLGKYIQVNSIFPHILAHCCITTKCKLIHVTTDCVFSGNRGKYNENDIHDETNIYGVSKSKGEPDICCCIRTSIIGEEIFNKKSLLEWIKSNYGNTIHGYPNHYWNGITCLQLAIIIQEIISRDIFWKGVRHIYSPEIISKLDIINHVNKIYELNITIEKKETDVIDKSLTSIYPQLFDIPTFPYQISQLKKFSSILFSE